MTMWRLAQCTALRSMSTMFRAAPVVCLVLCAILASCKDRVRVGPGELLVEAERVTASKSKTPQDIQPYDEALAWHEYRVKRVLAGKLEDPVVRVAHWTVLAAKPVPVSTKRGEIVTLKIVPFDSVGNLKGVAASDDLDFSAAEPPRFLDLSQSLAQTTTPGALRYDYRGNVSEQMRLYWKLRGQLRAVAMGNSHATKGINPRAIMEDEIWSAPFMLNMAPAGANNDQQCLMLREYVLPLPRLEWLFWVVSARNFNAERSDTRKHEEFTTSPGWLYDQKHKAELWPVPPVQKPVTSTELLQMGDWSLDIWGSLILQKSLLPAGLDEQRRFVLEKCRNTGFTWSDASFSKFCETACRFTDKGVKVLVLTTPFHPMTRDAEAGDPDGTTHEGFREMVRHMEEFDRATPHLWFHDFHNGGAHDFPPAEFYDVDHLNKAGTLRLGEAIKEWMKRCDMEEQAGGADAK